MESRSRGQRFMRRVMIFSGIGSGLLLQSTLSCGQEAKSILLVAAESLTVAFIQLLFDIITPIVVGLPPGGAQVSARVLDLLLA